MILWINDATRVVDMFLRVTDFNESRRKDYYVLSFQNL